MSEFPEVKSERPGCRAGIKLHLVCVVNTRKEGEKQQQRQRHTEKKRKKKTQKTSIFLSYGWHFLVGSPSGPAELLALTITAQCFAPLSYFTDNYRPQNRPNRSIPPSRPPSAGCQQSEIVLVYIRAGPSLAALLTWQESDLKQTIKDCQRRQTRGERCQHTRAAQTFPQLKQYPANGNTRMSARTADNRCCVATGSGLLAALSHTY